MHQNSIQYRVNAAEETNKSKTETKKEKAEYEKCLSKCLYTCTKPKGEETKLRTECLPGCKKMCAPGKQVDDKMKMSGSAY